MRAKLRIPTETSLAEPDRALAFQAGVRGITEQLNGCPFVTNGVYKRSVSLSGTSAQVQHGLGRVPVGVIVLKCTGAAAKVPEVVSSTSTSITLRTDVACVMDLWIF